MISQRTKPPSLSHGQVALGLNCPRGRVHWTLLSVPSAFHAPVPFALKNDKARPFASSSRVQHLRLCSPALPPLPPIHTLSGHKGPFLFAQPKEAGCQGDRSRNSRELAMGEGLCPQTAVSGSGPSWGRRACLSGGNTPREDTFLFATQTLPPTSLNCLPSFWGSQPALKNAPVTKQTLLQCTGLSRKHKHACSALPPSPLPH